MNPFFKAKAVVVVGGRVGVGGGGDELLIKGRISNFFVLRLQILQIFSDQSDLPWRCISSP